MKPVIVLDLSVMVTINVLNLLSPRQQHRPKQQNGGTCDNIHQKKKYTSVSTLHLSELSTEFKLSVWSWLGIRILGFDFAGSYG